LIVQKAFTARIAGQLFVCAKSPVTARELKFTGTARLFFTVATFAGLVAPMA